MTFFRGQKVVCVERFLNERKRLDITYPQQKIIYTIREIWRSRKMDADFFRLVEIRNARNCLDENGEWSEPGFWSARFRPVCDRPTDISLFTAMLNDKRVEVDA